MKFLVVGASGMVGQSLMAALKMRPGFGAYGTYNLRKKKDLIHLDMTDWSEVNKVFDVTRPDLVIQAAAQPNVDFCEQNRKEAWKVNVDGTKNIAQACVRYGAAPVFISTDYVFDGKAGPYSETDPVNPINYYAVTKVEAERILSQVPRSLIVRTCSVFENDAESKNFALRLIREVELGHAVKVPTDQYSNPTLSRNLSDAIIELASKGTAGLYHVAGKTIMPRYDFAIKIAERFDLNKTRIIPVSSEELAQIAPRPRRLGLIVSKADNELRSTRLLSAHEALDLFRPSLQWR